MERLKIIFGLVAIAGVIFLFGERGGEEQASVKPVERGFSSEKTSARFVPAAPRD
jgi:hypothetical protein